MHGGYAGSKFTDCYSVAHESHSAHVATLFAMAILVSIPIFVQRPWAAE